MYTKAEAASTLQKAKTEVRKVEGKRKREMRGKRD